MVIRDIYRIFGITNWGCHGLDCNVKVVPHVDKVRMSLNTYKTTKDEKSTMTYNDLMAFVGMDYAVAA